MKIIKEIYGKGYELLAFFNIDYHLHIADIANQLLRNPNKNFRLSLEEIPLNKTKAAKYIQPKPVRTKN